MDFKRKIKIRMEIFGSVILNKKGDESLLFNKKSIEGFSDSISELFYQKTKGMIKSKIFLNEDLMNDFINDSDIKIINIETKKELYDTKLPLPNGGTFIKNRDVIKMWYEEI